VGNPIFGKKERELVSKKFKKSYVAGELTMENDMNISTVVPRDLTRGYSNSYLDTRFKSYVPAVDQPALTIADLNAMDQS
jgi:hypothetical protein